MKEGEGGEHAALLARRWRRPGLPPPPRPAPCRRAGHLHRQVDPQSEACHSAQATALYSIRIIVQLFQPLSDRIQWEHFLRKKMQLTLIQFWERANCPLCPSFPFQPFFPLSSTSSQTKHFLTSGMSVPSSCFCPSSFYSSVKGYWISLTSKGGEIFLLTLEMLIASLNIYPLGCHYPFDQKKFISFVRKESIFTLLALQAAF